jgi:fructokinase
MATTLVELVRREQRRLVMVDPNIRPQLIADPMRYRCRLEHELFPASTVVKASQQDLDWLYPDLDVETACEHILSLGPRLVVATLGAEGAFGLTHCTRGRVGVPPVNVVDTIGAGDVFGAAMLAWLRDHHLLLTDLCLTTSELEAALTYASRAATWSCTRAGAESPIRRDILDINGQRDTHCDASRET